MDSNTFLTISTSLHNLLERQ